MPLLFSLVDPVRGAVHSPLCSILSFLAGFTEQVPYVMSSAGTDARHGNSVDETTPLIAAENAVLSSTDADLVDKTGVQHNPQPVGSEDGGDEDRPLPKGQIAVLFFARMIEPIAVRVSCNISYRSTNVLSSSSQSFLL